MESTGVWCLRTHDDMLTVLIMAVLTTLFDQVSEYM